MKLLILTEILRGSLFPNIGGLDSLPERGKLFASLKAFHQESAIVKVTEFSALEKYRWMKWLPTFGLGYNLSGAPVPTVGFSLSQIYNNLNDKEKNSKKIESILKSELMSQKEDSISLEIALKKVEILRGPLKWLDAAQSIDDEIFEAIKEKYLAKELSKEAYLSAKKALIEKAIEDEKQRQALQLAELEVLKIAKY
jgi:hypothetical protein